MSTTRRRLADAVTGVRPPLRLGYLNTTVTAVSAGTSLDGRAEVSIAVNSDTPKAPYLDEYVNGHTATVGDQVAVLMIDGSPLILGRIFGLPNI